MVRRVATILAALALSLAAPAAALAQGAGDDQYSDPFGSGQSGDSSDDGAQEPEPTPDASSPSEEPAPAPTATAAAQSSSAAPEQLPRTGDDAGVLALAGTVLLAGGVVLRRRVS
jgi:LPXTG-motif cell wall-anchored protein